MPRDLEPAAPPEAGYNTVFERLGADATPEGAVAYALCKAAKREWIKDVKRSHGRGPTEAELDAHSRARNDLTLDTYKAKATQIVSEYAETEERQIRTRIAAETLREKFWSAVRVSLPALPFSVSD
jgi:hypothetical protein